MIIAITGGIGCGKSIVSQLLRVMGYTVYDCDKEAKRLMHTDSQLRAQLCQLFGADTYLADSSLNRTYLASKIFGNEANQQAMNAAVHPAVARDILARYQQHTAQHTASNTPFFFESAILFEAGFNNLVACNQVWSVSAPLELRIERSMLRDHATRQQIEARIASQMSQAEKDKKADVIILNDNTHSIIQQVTKVLDLQH